MAAISYTQVDWAGDNPHSCLGYTCQYTTLEALKTTEWNIDSKKTTTKFSWDKIEMMGAGVILYFS